MVVQASKFCENVEAFVVKFQRLVVAEACVVQRAAIGCDDERDEAFFAVAHLLNGAASRVQVHPANIPLT